LLLGFIGLNAWEFFVSTEAHKLHAILTATGFNRAISIMLFP
jgi:hypothetical protein